MAIAWILAIAVAGFFASVDSLMGWLTVSVLAFGPATMLLHFLKEPPLTTSQTIHQARR